ncbi:MAG: response regulator [Candidatus Thermoplasmatota archaeon]
MKEDSPSDEKTQECGDDKIYKLLMVEDDFDITDQLERILKNAKRFDAEITTARNGNEGLSYLESNDFDVILAELEMPDIDSIEFLKKVRDEYSDKIMRFLIMEDGEPEKAKNALRDGIAHQYIENPWDSEEVRLTVCEKLKRKDIREDEKRMDVTDVSEAINTVEYFQEKMTDESNESIDKEKLIFEFDSSSEFNKFSFELKRMKNIRILDVHVFENKYVVNVGLYPKSYEKIK